ncbi:MAG: NTP transferase domain-containing protein [Candidatus Saccharibacteria bacterium]|nr:NTP transferase domain-containing protein [Candidatus Saccharibacteria bacterium]MCA9339724.1 NTP transferase domain-containing protein [Candidatus Saccharibacteria bacterium]
MAITKAIIPVAGWGTRRLPITKTIEKCMLPIGDRPLVDYVVQDCLAAGITELIFVVGEDSDQLQNYYRSNIKLNDYLKRNGKADKLPLVAPLAGVKLHFITQPSYGKYGTAVPVALAADFIDEGESAVVLMGDDFIYNSDGSSEVKRLIEATPDGECGLLAAHIAQEDVGKYGVIEQDKNENYVRIVDQPAPEEAPSNLINISKYILTKEVIERAANLPPAHNGEYQLPDAINDHVAAGGNVKVVAAAGEYLDGGSVEGWVHANNVVLGSA